MEQKPKEKAAEFKEPSVQNEADFVGHEFTRSGMVAHLLKSGFTVDQIAGRIVLPTEEVKVCLGDSSPLGSQVDQSTLMLKDFYLREQVKSLLRASPFLGVKTGARRLGISMKDYELVYSALIGSGEVTFVMDIPDWGDAGSKKVPLRKHSVK